MPLLLFCWGLPISEEDGYITSLHQVFITLGEILHSNTEMELQCLNFIQENCLPLVVKLTIVITLAINCPALLQQLPQFLSLLSKQDDIVIIYSQLFRLKRDKQDFLKLTVLLIVSNKI